MPIPDECKIIGEGLAREIWKGAKRLSKEQITDVVNRMRGMANNIKTRNPSLTTQQASKIAAAAEAKRARQFALKRSQQVYLQAAKNKLNKEYASRFSTESTGLLHRIRGGEGQVKGSQDSLNFQMVTEGARFLTHKDGLLDKIQQAGLNEKWWDKSIENQYNLARACWGKKVDDPDMQQMGQFVNENAEWLRKTSNFNGGDIPKLPNRITRSIHNPFIMRRMADSFPENEKLKLQTLFNEERRRDLAFKHWSDYGLEKFDLEKTFPEVIPGEGSYRKAMRTFWEENDTGTYRYNQDLSATTNYALNKGFPLARRGAQRRVFHFKSPEAQVDYMNKYGGMSIQEAIGQDIQRASRDIATLKWMGPDGINEMDRMIKEAVGKERTNTATANLHEWERLKNVLNGTTSTVHNYKLATLFSNLRMATSFARLGKAVFHATSDLVHQVRTLEFNGMNPFEAHAEVVKNVYESIPGASAEKKLEMDRIAYSGRNVIGQMSSRYGIGEIATRTTRKLQAIFYRYIGLTPWDKIRTGENTGSLVRFLGQSRNLAYEKLEPQLKHSLMLSNIGEKEWEAVRNHAQTGYDGKKIICADIGRELPDNVVLDYLGKTKASAATIERAKTRIEDLFANYFYNQEMHVVPLPTLREQATVTRGLPRGTWSRELWGNFWQFKTFPLSFMRRLYARELHSGLHGKIFSNIDATKGSIFGIVRLATEISLVNVFVNTALSLAEGKGIPDFRKPHNIFMALLPLSGLYRDLFSPHFATFGHGVGEIMAGAPGGWLNDILREGRTLFSNPLKSAVQFTRYDAPGSNYFMVRPILDNLVLNYLAEIASPGSNRRAEHRLMKTTGQSSNYRWVKDLVS